MNGRDLRNRLFVHLRFRRERPRRVRARGGWHGGVLGRRIGRLEVTAALVGRLLDLADADPFGRRGCPLLKLAVLLDLGPHERTDAGDGSHDHAPPDRSPGPLAALGLLDAALPLPASLLLPGGPSGRTIINRGVGDGGGGPRPGGRPVRAPALALLLRHEASLYQSAGDGRRGRSAAGARERRAAAGPRPPLPWPGGPAEARPRPRLRAGRTARPTTTRRGTGAGEPGRRRGAPPSEPAAAG